MFKKTPYLAIIFSLFISCQKQHDINVPTGDGQKNITLINNTPPTAVTSPTVFFIESFYHIGDDDAILYQANKLLTDKPELTQVGTLKASDALFKFLTATMGWAYNTSTNEITTTSVYNYIHKLSTTGLKLSINNFFGTPGDYNANIKLSPDNTKFYIVSGIAGGSIVSGDVSGKFAVQTIFDENNKTKIGSMDIDFVESKIYFTDIISNSIYAINLDGTNKVKVASIPLGETVDRYKLSFRPVLRVDKSQNKIFLSTHSNAFQTKQKFKLFSVSTTGTGWKKLLETLDSGGQSTFSFDIVPGNNKIFYSLYQAVNPYPTISIVGSVNMDGTANSLIYTGKRVDNIVVAMPKGLK